MRPTATAAAQRALGNRPPNEKKCGAISPVKPSARASASARTSESVAARLGERARGRGGARQREQLANQSRLAREPLREGAHAAALREAQQRGERGRAGKPDAHRQLDAERAQPDDPGQRRAGLEAEL